MTDVYLVNWMGGTSGAFVSALLNQFIHEPLPHEEITFSEYGDSHGVSDRYQTNIKIIEGIEHIPHVRPIYKSIVPLDSNKPFVMLDHAEPDYDDLFSLYPTCKNIVITISDNMLYRARGNMLFKNRCQAYRHDPASWHEHHKEIDWLKSVEDPNNMDLETAEIYIKNHGINLYAGNAFYHTDSIVPEKYKSNIFKISFYNVIHQSDIVLQQLSEITGRPILDGHVNFYKKYLEKQAELVSTKMPWLIDG
jgi:hypothetical protein